MALLGLLLGERELLLPERLEPELLLPLLLDELDEPLRDRLELMTSTQNTLVAHKAQIGGCNWPPKHADYY